jgi:hypothetical protein
MTRAQALRRSCSAGCGTAQQRHQLTRRRMLLQVSLHSGTNLMGSSHSMLQHWQHCQHD